MNAALGALEGNLYRPTTDYLGSWKDEPRRAVPHHWRDESFHQFELPREQIEREYEMLLAEIELSLAKNRRSKTQVRYSKTDVIKEVMTGVWPVISFAIGVLAVLFALVFYSQGMYIHIIPAGFASFVFVSLGFVVAYLRKQVRHAWQKV